MQIRECCAVLFVLGIISQLLNVQTRGDGQKSHLPQIVEKTAELIVDHELDKVQRYRDEHQYIEVLFRFGSPEEKRGDGQKDKAYVPAEICKESGYVGIIAHDESIYRPVIIAEDVREKQSAQAQITSSRDLYVSEKAAEQGRRKCQKHAYVLDRFYIHKQHYTLFCGRFRQVYYQERRDHSFSPALNSNTQ